MQNSTDTLSTVADLKALPVGSNLAFTGVFLLKKVSERTARNGAPFLSVELADAWGAFNFTAFSDTEVFAALVNAQPGAIFEVKGFVDYYQERLSPRVQSVRLLEAQEAEAIKSQLVESSLEDSEALWEELQGFIAAIEQPQLRATVEAVMDEIGDAFRATPGAISMHHAYRHGLLEHTVHMARAATVLFPLYIEVDPSLAMAGIILHDVGKTLEYEGELATKKSKIGILQGHVVLGYRLVRKAAIKSKLAESLVERLEHIILSHQGELEWGAAAMAATAEAVFVSMVDNLDAKMGIVQYALRQAKPGDDLSPYQPGLKTTVLLEPVDS